MMMMKMKHVKQKVRVNNLKLNWAKSREVIFISSKHKIQNISIFLQHYRISRTCQRSESSASVMNRLSISEHVLEFIAKSAQTKNVLKICRLNCEVLTAVYKNPLSLPD